MSDVTGTEYTVISHMREGYLVHKVGCRDIARAERQGYINQKWNVTVADGEDIARAVALDMECGQAEDNDMTPDEYVDMWGLDGRVFPCCLTAKQGVSV